MEYATLGRALERARERYLPHLLDRRFALVLGDGDGRFTAKLLSEVPGLRVEAVDTSEAMLALLARRAAPDRTRLSTVFGDGLTHEPATRPDLVVTHFFLDCFEQPAVNDLAGRLARLMVPGGMWVVTEFRIPGGWMRAPAWLLVRTLYFAFRVLTGLRTKGLPDHEHALEQAGLVRTDRHLSLLGLLTSETWLKPPA